jgi:hypothetical protein
VRRHVLEIDFPEPTDIDIVLTRTSASVVAFAQNLGKASGRRAFFYLKTKSAAEGYQEISTDPSAIISVISADSIGETKEETLADDSKGKRKFYE